MYRKGMEWITLNCKYYSSYLNCVMLERGWGDERNSDFALCPSRPFNSFTMQMCLSITCITKN